MDIASLLAAAAMTAAPTPPATPPPESPAPAPVVGAPAVKALDAADLDGLRGGDGLNAVITDQTLNAVNAGNSVNGQTVGSGDIAIGSEAFSGFAGIGNFAINSGHNNNLQASISVSINYAPPTAGP